MASLEDITKKIIDDGNKTADEILEAAKEQAREYDRKIMLDANEICHKNLQAAKEEGQRLYDQICATKEMELRDEILFLKEGMLDHVFDCAHEELKSLDQEEYMQFLTLNLSLKELEGYVLIIPERYLQDHESEIENALKTSGVTGNYTLINGSKHGVTNGFVLMKDGIEENHTFDSWIGYLREEMEGEILDILYERG